MNNKYLQAILVLALVVVAGYVLISALPDQDNTEISPSPTLSTTFQPTNTAFISPSPETLPDNWQTYESSDPLYSFSYPEDIEFSQNQGSVVLEQWGPTQEQGTEFYDGISLTFNPQSIETGTLREIAEDRREEFEAEPVTETVSELATRTINDQTVYSFSVTSLGEREYIFYPLQDDSYLEITNATQDPANQGYASTVDSILASINSNSL